MKLIALASAVVVLGLSGFAGSAEASPLRSVHLVKDCTDFFTGGNSCFITESTVPQLPVGSTFFYNGPVFNDVVLSMQVVINTPQGTATGQCTWPLAVRPRGTCAFARGTGSLAGFHANLSVVSGGGVLFILDGTYQL